MHACTHTHARTHARTHTHTLTHTHTHMHTCMHTHIDARACIYITWYSLTRSDLQCSDGKRV